MFNTFEIFIKWIVGILKFFSLNLFVIDLKICKNQSHMKKITDYNSITDFYNDVYRDHLHQDIVDFPEVQSIDLFRYRFKKKLVIKNIYVIQEFTCRHINCVIDNYILGQNNICTPIPNFEFIFFSTIAEEEKRIAKQKTNVWMLEKDRNKLEDYVAFLKSKNEILSQISDFKSNIGVSSINSSQLGVKYPVVNFTNKKEVNSKVDNLLKDVDDFYVKYLQTFREDYEYINLPEEHIKAIQESDLVNPVCFMEYPEHKIQYNKLVKTLFIDHLQQRSKTLGWKRMPSIYIKVQELVSELFVTNLDNINNNNPQTETILETPETIAFPTHIFLNIKAYQLFIALIENATLINQIAFVFRQMSEIENPPLIVVKDAPFRKWYNDQAQFQIKLDNTTPTYNNTKNEDRILAYKNVKKYMTSINNPILKGSDSN